MKIPVPVIAVVSDVLAMRYTHSRLDFLMEQAGIEGEPPPGNKVDKTRSWLKRANADGVRDALPLLGKVLEEFMEVDSAGYGVQADLSADRERVTDKLAEYGLAYVRGGHVVRANFGAVSRGLEQIIRDHDLAGIQAEFDRISNNIESDPPAQLLLPAHFWNPCSKSTSQKNSLRCPQTRVSALYGRSLRSI